MRFHLWRIWSLKCRTTSYFGLLPRPTPLICEFGLNWSSNSSSTVGNKLFACRAMSQKWKWTHFDNMASPDIFQYIFEKSDDAVKPFSSSVTKEFHPLTLLCSNLLCRRSSTQRNTDVIVVSLPILPHAENCPSKKKDKLLKSLLPIGRL